MLKQSGYEPGRHILDNSCGDGAILCEVVKLIFETRPLSFVKYELETFVHGIELEKETYDKCIENLNNLVHTLGLKCDVKWDIRNADALATSDFDGKMDYVIANPPYVRTHDITGGTENYSFASEGMKDLYLAFFELGFRQMNSRGKMVYITPSSWYTSLAANKMRKYILDTTNLTHIWDFQHTKVFEDALTYVSIALFDNEHRHYAVRFNEATVVGENIVCEAQYYVSYDDMVIKDEFYFGNKEDLEFLKQVLENTEKQTHIVAKNGYATLLDDVFIGDFLFKEKCIIPIIKTSTGEEKDCIYPYDENGKILSETEFSFMCPNTYQYLLEHKELLCERKTEEPWYGFGRTQGLGDTMKKKYTIKQIVKNTPNFGIMEAGPGTGVYGGLYVITEPGYEKKFLAMMDQRFVNYIKLLRKYKAGGYYTFSTKDINSYMSYILKFKKRGRKLVLTYEKCKEIVKSCGSKKEVREKYSSVYTTISRMKWSKIWEEIDSYLQ